MEKCAHCPDRIRHKNKASHLKENHQIEIPDHLKLPEKCDLCGLTLKDKHSYKNHFKRVHEKSRLHFKCKQCDYISADNCSVIRHWNRVHADYTTKELLRSFKCLICNNPGYVRKDKLKLHVVKVHGTEAWESWTNHDWTNHNWDTHQFQMEYKPKLWTGPREWKQVIFNLPALSFKDS